MQLLKVDQAAAKLAVSTWTIRRLVNDGELFALKVRGGLRIDADSVRRYVHKQGELFSLENGFSIASMSKHRQA